MTYKSWSILMDDAIGWIAILAGFYLLLGPWALVGGGVATLVMSGKGH